MKTKAFVIGLFLALCLFLALPVIDRVASTSILSPGPDPQCMMWHQYYQGTALDASRHNNNGTVTGATFVTGGLQFAGSGTEKVSVPTNQFLNVGTGDWAYYAWIKPLYNSEVGSDLTMIMSQSSVGDGYILFFVDQSLTTWLLQGEVNVPNGDHYYDTRHTGDGAGPYSYGVWTFVGYEIDRDVGGYLVINGVRVKGPIGNTYSSAFPSWSTPLTVGLGDGVMYAGPYKGMIGEDYVFNTIQDRLTLYNNTKVKYE